MNTTDKKTVRLILFTAFNLAAIFLLSCNNADDARGDENIIAPAETNKPGVLPDDSKKDTTAKFVAPDKKYVLKSYNGKDVTGDFSFTLDKDNNINARFCNSIFGLCTFSGNKLKASDQLSSTMMACAEPGKMELEQAFTQAITEGVTIINMGKQVSLLNSKGVSFLFEVEQ
mgnify:FL=1